MIELFKHITGIYRVDADYIKLDNQRSRQEIEETKGIQNCEAELPDL